MIVKGKKFNKYKIQLALRGHVNKNLYDVVVTNKNKIVQKLGFIHLNKDNDTRIFKLDIGKLSN